MSVRSRIAAGVCACCGSETEDYELIAEGDVRMCRAGGVPERAPRREGGTRVICKACADKRCADCKDCTCQHKGSGVRHRLVAERHYDAVTSLTTTTREEFRSALATFLTARLDEKQAKAQRILEAVWPTQVYVTPSMDSGQPVDGEPTGSVAVAEHGPKAFVRLWNPNSAIGAGVEHGWNVHETAVEVWSRDIAHETLREVEATRELVRLAERAHDYHETFMNGFGSAMEQVLRLYAAAHADHPDYLHEWRP